MSYIILAINPGSTSTKIAVYEDTQPVLSLAIDPSAAEAFDREFPAKGKVVGTESQRRFDEIVVVRRPAE